jgi:hypothetical protein
LQRNEILFDKNENRNEKEMKYYLSFGCLTIEPISNHSYPKSISFLSPQETGISSGNYLGMGNINRPTNSIDQREDDGRSLCFDCPPLIDDCGTYLFYLNIKSILFC